MRLVLPHARYRELATGVVTIVAAAAALCGLLALLLVVTGHEPGRALQAFWLGSFGSRYTFASATLVRATPLILAGLAVALAFRAGVWNIGAEGQLLAGAAAAAAIGLGWGTQLGTVGIVTGLLAGALGGALLAGVAAVLRARFAVLEIISTIMLNFVALHGVGYLIRGPLQEPTGLYPQSATLPEVSRLPLLVPGTRLHWGILLAMLAAIVLWIILRHTAVGFRIRAVGSNPTAARSAGSIDVARTTLWVFIASGALAGLAGAVEVYGVTYALYENLSPGYGYTAIAVALLARLNPLGILLTGALLGALEAGGAAMQRDAAVPSVVVSIVEAVLILAMVTGAGRSLIPRRARANVIEPSDDPPTRAAA
jgi:simple sugar transport system permease protein